VKILSIQECDNKIKIIKMVRRKRPRLLPSFGSSILIDISDDEDKENIIEIQDSDDEEEISKNEKEKSLMITEATSLGDSTNIFMQDLLTEFKNDEKSPRRSFMENFALKSPENDKNNNLPLTPPPESPKSQPTEYLAKLKCHRTCHASRMHQKKHRADISSEIGILLTRRDKIDENYQKNSLKKIEEYSKAIKVDKFDNFIHATRNGRISKSPKGRFGRKIQPSEILAVMKSEGRERSVIMRWGRGKC
jgi:hypothetical protein